MGEPSFDLGAVSDTDPAAVAQHVDTWSRRLPAVRFEV